MARPRRPSDPAWPLNRVVATIRDKLSGDPRATVGAIFLGPAPSGVSPATVPARLQAALPEGPLRAGEELLVPHRCYAPAVLALLDEFDIHAMAHLTGGGFYENIPRVLPADCSVVIERRSWPVPPIFSLIQERGNVPDPEMYRTFNMGIGLVLIVPAEQAPLLAHRLNALDESAYIVGDVVRGAQEVNIP